MRVLIIYDSEYGNTAEIAAAVAGSLKSSGVISLKTVDEAGLDDITHADVVIIGSPTQGGRPTVAIQQFLLGLPSDALKGKQVTAFDTRFSLRAHGFFLRLLMRAIGFASPRIVTALQANGGQLLTAPEGFIVHDKTGPLEPGELDRARTWLVHA